MSKRWLVFIPGLAALFCAAIMLYLMVEIDQTRKQLQGDGVLEFNFIQQADHNFDTFAQAVIDFQTASDPAPQDQLRDNYILHYDILYSLFQNTTTGWLGSLVDLKETHQLLADANQFLDEYEPVMTPDVSLPASEAFVVIAKARYLSSRVYELGLQMFERKSVTRENISKRMDALYDAFWIFGISFLLASLMTIFLLVTLSRRAANLSADAQQTQTQLSTALDELTSGDIERQAQNRFMAAASHDLRQPLHALGLYLSALKKHVSSDQGQQILSNINRSTEALNQLLNSMLDLSKLDAGVVDVNIGIYPLDELFDHLQQSFLPEAQQRSLVLAIQCSGLYVKSDRVLLERILGNLVSNALNYTPTGSVTLKAEQQAQTINISVIDTGLGIPIKEQEAVFNEYYQLNNPERDRTKGLGLGLSIVKRLTRLLNLQMQIESAEGTGTRFDIQVPAGQPEQNVTPSRIANTRLLATNLTGLSILVIDDELEVRDGMHALLIQQGCDVVLADSCASAVDHIISNEWLPELIIADYRLRDEQTGDTAIERVREEINMDIPAMIITGDTSPARLRNATFSGFQLLHKPVVARDLLKAIAHLLEERV